MPAPACGQAADPALLGWGVITGTGNLHEVCHSEYPTYDSSYLLVLYNLENMYSRMHIRIDPVSLSVPEPPLEKVPLTTPVLM